MDWKDIWKNVILVTGKDSSQIGFSSIMILEFFFQDHPLFTFINGTDLKYIY
jgi:hypothetical protein